ILQYKQFLSFLIFFLIFPLQKSAKGIHGVQSYPNFDPSADVVALDRAITVKGKRKEALKKALKGRLEDVVVALLKTPAQFDAEELRASMKGLGTDEDTLIEILASRTNQEITEANRYYKEVLKRDLTQDIISDTSGDFQKALVALAKVCYKDDPQSVLCCSRTGQRQSRENTGFFSHYLVFQKYTKYSKHDMNKVLDLELKGDIENCLTALVKCATSKPAFFAEKLHLAMKGSGTRHKDLIRIMVSRHEVDMNEIKGYYKSLYGISLRQAIMDELKGDYETILVALCGSDN
ncbi:ANX12 protein, partial [Copsychus sechellarum]|nr:ANX12 protein [Copsychus sechellarum]